MKDRFPFPDPQVQKVLAQLHRNASADKWKFLRRMPHYLWAKVTKREFDTAFQQAFFHDIYIPVSREQGALLYLTARAVHAKRVAEFGSSFGISTIYLAAALRDNGGGQVFGSELDPIKHARATKNIQEAGLSEFAKILLGDARETLRAVPAPLDLVLLDGAKDLYLPVLELLKPKLLRGAIVLSDNIFTFRKALRPFVEYMQSGHNGFASTTLRISDGFEFSVFAGSTAESRARLEM